MGWLAGEFVYIELVEDDGKDPSFCIAMLRIQMCSLKLQGANA